jgi:hypothetical protein
MNKRALLITAVCLAACLAACAKAAGTETITISFTR